jgi:hypothetical protein
VSTVLITNISCYLNSTDAMRKAAAVRSGPDRLHRVLSLYAGPRRIKIDAGCRNRNSSEEDFESSGEEYSGSNGEDEDQRDVESSDEENGYDDGEDKINEDGAENAKEEESED